LETYDGPLPPLIVLDDATTVINNKVNLALKAARDKTGGKAPAMAAEIYALLGKPTSMLKAHLAPIEEWASGLLAATPLITGTPGSGNTGTIYQPRVEDSQYHDTTRGIGTRDLAPVMQVGNTLFGVDKLGHFFQLGYANYYQLTLGSGGLSDDAAATEGDKSEAGMFGLDLTGVYSNADIAANRAGLRFYKEIAATPALNFSIRAYLTDQWNEQSNANLYSTSLSNDMFRHNLPGRWTGFMGWTDGSTPVTVSFPATFDLMGARSYEELKRLGDVQHFTGTYQYQHPLSSFTSGQLDGTLSNAVNSDGAVIGSTIDLTWAEGKASGKGKLKIDSLKALSGTWGRGDSATDGGTWRFTKI
jgi:hypothetical protein